jgi:hypothetical protein
MKLIINIILAAALTYGLLGLVIGTATVIDGWKRVQKYTFGDIGGALVEVIIMALLWPWVVLGWLEDRESRIEAERDAAGPGHPERRKRPDWLLVIGCAVIYLLIVGTLFLAIVFLND